MAQIKLLRLRADSLMEVVVAAVLVMIIFGIAMMVVSNVLHASRPVKEVRAAAVLRLIAGRVEMRQDTAAADTAFDKVTVRLRLYPAEQPGAAYLQLFAFDRRADTLAKLNKIILWHEK